MRTVSSLIVAMTLMAGLMTPPQAEASIDLYAQQAGFNGGNPFLIATGADFTSAGFSGVYGTFSLTILGTSSTNGADLSDLLTAAVRLTNLSASQQTLTIYSTQTGYTLPAGTPLNVESSLGGTIAQGTLGGGGFFQAYLDAGNNPLGTSDFTNGPQAVVLDGSSFDTGSAEGLFNRDGPYSMTSVITANISGGGEGNFAGHINVTSTVVPEPGTVALALTGLPLLGFVAWRKRRIG